MSRPDCSAASRERLVSITWSFLLAAFSTPAKLPARSPLEPDQHQPPPPLLILSPIGMAVVFRRGDPMDTGLTAAAAEPPSKMFKGIQRNKHMLFNERLSDVTFSVGAIKKSAKKIPAHTFLLAEASEVFEAMFADNWKRNEPIRIIDFEAPTFCSLLRWIYCDELIFPPDMLADVMKIAQKYFVYSLISLLSDNFNEEYVWSIHTMANELEMTDLIQKSFNIIKSYQATHLSSADFLNASCQSVTAFVSMDRSSVTDLQLFTRCLKWSEKECERQKLAVQPANQRSVMELFIYLISFESMSASEFAGLPCESGVLTGEEQAIILRIKAGQNVESRFKKKQQQEGKKCKNWKPVTEIHFRCNNCSRYVCTDCFGAGIGNTANPVCSNCPSRGQSKPYTLTLHRVSRDNCAGSR